MDQSGKKKCEYWGWEFLWIGLASMGCQIIGFGAKSVFIRPINNTDWKKKILIGYLIQKN